MPEVRGIHACFPKRTGQLKWRVAMQPNFFELANESIRTLTPYQPGKPVEELERELGISSSVKLAVLDGAGNLDAGIGVPQSISLTGDGAISGDLSIQTRLKFTAATAYNANAHALIALDAGNGKKITF